MRQGHAPMHFLDIGVIVRLRQDARDHPPLSGHPEAGIGAELLDPAE